MLKQPRRGALMRLFVLLTVSGIAVGFAARGSNAASSDLFFSEYIEGSSNNKALEIYNGTGAPVDLAAGGYQVQVFFNGSASAGLTINLTGTVAPGDVFVLAHSSANAAIQAQADQFNGAGWFNGDDAVVLRRTGGVVIDSIGQTGFDPGTEWGTGVISTADNTLRRRASISAGDTNNTDAFDPSLEWDGFSTDDSDGLGLHPGVRPPAGALTIGEVQGAVADSANGATFQSPKAGQTVTIQGVIYQKTLARSSAGALQHGFFIQNTAANDDNDPLSSDGLFVFIGGFTTVLNATSGGPLYTPQIGDEVVLRGTVAEFFNLTELTSPRWIRTDRAGVSLDEVPAFEADPPSELAAANRYWERREGMRARIAANSPVLDGRDVFPSTLDGEVWVVNPNYTPITGRTDPFTRRAYRDPHPMDDLPGSLFDNGNGYRIILGSLGLKAANEPGETADSTRLIAPARTFDTIGNSLVGGVYFSFGKYQIQVTEQPELTPGVDPSLNAPPQAFNRGAEYSISTYNVENLYDFRDDPFDPADFTGNPGNDTIRPPFDYVPASEAVYQAHLHDIARQIIGDLHGPDLLLIQEAEDQDIASVQNGALVVPATPVDNADGKPDTLQELALVIRSLGGPEYDAAYDRDGADDRGIVSAFLYRKDRVELLPAKSDDPVLGATPQVEYRSAGLSYNTDVQNPKALNADLPSDVDLSTGVDGNDVFTRAPQVGLFRIWRTGIGTSTFTDLYALSNHFSSTPQARVGQRTEQAAYDAAIVEALQDVNPDVRIAVGGDFNVFPRPDDPFSPGDPRFPTDQLGPLYEQGLLNLWEVLAAEVPQSAYSYVFQGQAQTLDQIFVTESLFDDLVQIRAAHVNADFPADYIGDGPRGASDHDPQVSRFSALPAFGDLIALINYYAGVGRLDPKKASILIDRVIKMERFLNSHQDQAYNAQLQALINQIRGFSPNHLERGAAAALEQEALLLPVP